LCEAIAIAAIVIAAISARVSLWDGFVMAALLPFPRRDIQG
jgi:hypothetical protein